jgi:hypothetical protein
MNGIRLEGDAVDMSHSNADRGYPYLKHSLVNMHSLEHQKQSCKKKNEFC